MNKEETESVDVVILGGGLAGATLAIQLLRAQPTLSVVVVERIATPLPEAACKVGESTVEVGANYFMNVLDLKDHIEKHQLPKFGLRYFFGGDRKKIETRLELGGNQYTTTRSCQLDRGRFENHLREKVVELGGRLLAPGRVREAHIQNDSERPQTNHVVTIDFDGKTFDMSCRWLVDTSGRNAFVKRRLGLQKEVGHKCNASWWRVRGKVDVSSWGEDEAWKSWEDGTRARWYSTNHLMGAGYWVWVIPLASGFTSIGIVADEALHPSTTISTHQKSTAWLEANEPQCAEQLKGFEVVDFLFLKNFAHGCKQVFSENRWALSGEAGVFLDPFYSPGSDFISISNTYITDLILRDMAGESIEARSMMYNQVYLNFFERTLMAYENQYPLFGNSVVAPLKIVWDYALYWSTTGTLAFEKKMTDLKLLAAFRQVFDDLREMNRQMQTFFREWAKVDYAEPKGRMLTFFQSPYLIELNRQLSQPDDEPFEERFRKKIQALKGIAAEIGDFAKERSIPKEILEKIDWSEPTDHLGKFIGDIREAVAA